MSIYHDDYDHNAYQETLKMSSGLKAIVKAAENIPLAAELIENLFYSFYRPAPQLVDEQELAPSERIARTILNEIMSTAEWDNVRKAGTTGDQLYSGMATANVARTVLEAFNKELLAKLQALREAEEEARNLFANAETLDDIAGQSQGDRAQALYEQAKQAREQAEQDQEEAEHLAEEISEQAEEIEDTARQAARTALEKAEGEIESTEAAIATFTGGYSKGNGRKSDISTKEKLALAGKVGKSEKLKQIAELTGRLTRIALQTQKSKVKHPPDEIVGVRIGKDLDKTLPVEMAQLADTELETFFFKKLVEGQLMQLDMVGSEKQGRGPIIIALDSSGSMAGGSPYSKEAESKAVGMALLAIAQKQRRDFAVIHFSHGTQMKVFEFPKGEAKPDDLINCADYFSGGGTEYRYWMQKALSLIEQSRYDRADVIIVSDGLVNIPTDLEQDWNRRRAAKGMRCYSVLLGDDSQALTKLARISDAMAKTTDLANDAQALKMMFSV